MSSPNFQLATAEEFRQSICQNRILGIGGGIITPLTFYALAEAPSENITSIFDGLLTANDTFRLIAYQGVLNSIAVDGFGNASSWNVDWTTAFNPTDPPIVKSGSYNGFYSYRYFNFALQGIPSKIYGTLAFHKAVTTPGVGATWEPAFSSYQRDWTTRFDMQNNSFLTVPPSDFTYALAFWIGKTPADLPAENFIFEDYGLGLI